LLGRWTEHLEVIGHTPTGSRAGERPCCTSRGHRRRCARASGRHGAGHRPGRCPASWCERHRARCRAQAQAAFHEGDRPLLLRRSELRDSCTRSGRERLPLRHPRTTSSYRRSDPRP